MIFDTLCRHAERCIPAFVTPLRYAALLEIPATHLEAAGDLDIAKEFRLPWKAVAVVTTMGGAERCVFIERIGRIANAEELRTGLTVSDGSTEGWKKAHSEPGPVDAKLRAGTADVGLLAGDAFRVAATTSYGPATKPPAPEILSRLTAAERAAITPRAMSTTMAFQAYILGPDGMCFDDDHMVDVVEREGQVRRLVRDEKKLAAVEARMKAIGMVGRDQVFDELCAEFLTALRLATLSTSPSHWILSKSSSTAKRADSPKIPRSHERKRYLLITDAERVRHFRTEEAVVDSAAPQHAVTPHPRRAHYRCIGTNEDGTRRHTWVRACWVGSKEAEIRGSRYRVELEL